MNERTVNRNPRKTGALRRIGPIVALILVSSFAVRTWIVQGIVLPVRVVSGSMGARLPGPHWLVVCRDCGYSFRCGQDFPPRDNLAVCPNCGCGTNELSDVTPRPGHRVLIDKLSLHVRPLRRWETIAARLPGPDSCIAVKRVVGLPGERVSFRDGDVLVNGNIVCKEPETLSSVAELVHDSFYRPSKPSPGLRRWQPLDPSSCWKEYPGRFRFASDLSCSDTSRDQSTDAPRLFADRATKSDVDWLVYHHVPCLPAPSLRDRESPVFDNYAYNQGLTRQLHEVGDLLVTFRVKMSGRGALAVELDDGWSAFQLVWQTGDRSIRLFHDSSEVAQGVASEFTEGDLNDWLCCVCDHQFAFTINRKSVLTYRYAPKTVNRQPSAQPLAIGAAGLAVGITDLRVWRDVYYAHPNGTSEEWSLGRTLAADEYFLIGDNSPISRDGRHGPENGIISQQAIVGRVVPFPLDSHPRRSPRR